MITLDFRIDEQEFANDLASDPSGANAGVLEETYFVCPVRFCVDGCELLSLSADGTPWRDLPLLGMAWGIREVSGLLSGRDFRLYLAGGGHLDFQCEDEVVRIINSLSGTEARAPRSELQESATEFVQRLRDTFRTRAPELQHHGGWSTWFG
jgi:hypothetical protein